VWLTLGLVLGTLFALGLLVTALAPVRAAVALGAATNVVQLYTVSLLGIYPSLALLAWLACWRSVLGSPLWKWPWMRALLALTVLQAASLYWSPSPMLGIRYLIYLLPLPLAAHAFYRLERESPDLARRCFYVLVLGSALEAVLVILFRVRPSAEIAFLTRPLARLFVSPNTLDALFYEGRNNVLDAAKSGGLFVNANIAAAYLGMSAIGAWYFGRIRGSALLRAVAVLDFGAVFFTGSKAGLLCGLGIPSLLGVAGVLRSQRVNPLAVFAGALVLALGAAGLVSPLGLELIDDYRYDTLATLGSREQIWSYATRMIEQHPLAGLGFGGWEQRFVLNAFVPGTAATTVPPHNSLFILWLQSGLPGVLGGLALIVTIYAAAARVSRSPDASTRGLAVGVAGAFTWYFVQGLGENFGLVGEVHMTPLLGALLGTLCARFDGATVRHEHSIEPVRGAVAPSAIPAV
jgi:O-antigen ligase